MSWATRFVGFVMCGCLAMPALSEEFEGKPVTALPWAKLCLGDTCFTSSGKRNECRLVVGVSLYERNGETHRALHVTLPKIVDVSRGARIQIDDGEPISRQFDQCHPAGCTAAYQGGPELVDQLSQGRMLIVEAIDRMGSPLRLSLQLAGFAAAHNGPAGPEPKVFEESQIKLREQLERRKQTGAESGCETR